MIIIEHKIQENVSSWTRTVNLLQIMRSAMLKLSNKRQGKLSKWSLTPWPLYMIWKLLSKNLKHTVDIIIWRKKILIFANTANIKQFLCACNCTYLYCTLGNFCKNSNFNNFANDPSGYHKRCGIAIFRGI